MNCDQYIDTGLISAEDKRRAAACKFREAVHRSIGYSKDSEACVKIKKALWIAENGHPSDNSQIRHITDELREYGYNIRYDKRKYFSMGCHPDQAGYKGPAWHLCASWKQ